MQYSIEELVRVARRDNNPNRPYLYVNPLQGKHIPTKPEDTLRMCKKLAEIVNDAYPKDNLYVIGFAETATGIASAVSHFLNNIVFYQNTTREYRKEENYLFFTENHSHATDQTLRITGIAECISKVDRVVFIDDEITTGSTICNLINIFKEKFDTDHISFSAVSFLNSLTDERKNLLQEEGIDFIYLMDIPFEYNIDKIIDIQYESDRDIIINSHNEDKTDELLFKSFINIRRINEFKKYDEEVRRFALYIKKNMHYEFPDDVLILGTEEFMYPALCLARFLKEDNQVKEVCVQATTRSPIIASSSKDYPLTNRFCIKSLYEASRPSYVYNLKKYDKIMIVTDAPIRTDGDSDLVCALKSVGNQDITLLRWIYK